jgi:acyl-CoA dehydrogenase
MDLGVSDRVRPLLDAVRTFITDGVLPVDEEFLEEVAKGDRWSLTARQAEIVDGLKAVAREQGRLPVRCSR